jgi:hypothetical protein
VHPQVRTATKASRDIIGAWYCTWPDQGHRPETEPEPEPKSEPETEPETEPKSEPESESETDSETESESEPGPAHRPRARVKIAARTTARSCIASYHASVAKRVDPIEFIARHGVVLASAKGPVPTLAEAIAGEPIRGSWWGHKKGQQIFQALSHVEDSPDVRCFRLVQGKITFVHRRLWPALVRLAGEIGPQRLTAIHQEHTKTGAHRNVLTPFPAWVPRAITQAARKLTADDARAQLGPWL